MYLLLRTRLTTIESTGTGACVSDPIVVDSSIIITKSLLPIRTYKRKVSKTAK